MGINKGILRNVSYEIDMFEMEHYNEEKKDCGKKLLWI